MKYLFLMACLAACDPMVSVTGRTEPASAGEIVRLDCPNGSRLTLNAESTTNTEGEFSFNFLGCLPLSCWVVIRGVAGPTIENACVKTVWACPEGTCSDVRAFVSS